MATKTARKNVAEVCRRVLANTITRHVRMMTEDLYKGWNTPVADSCKDRSNELLAKVGFAYEASLLDMGEWATIRAAVWGLLKATSDTQEASDVRFLHRRTLLSMADQLVNTRFTTNHTA